MFRITPGVKMPTMLEVAAEWDDEAGVWMATSDDVPGLVTETPGIEALVERLKIIIPE